MLCYVNNIVYTKRRISQALFFELEWLDIGSVAKVFLLASRCCLTVKLRQEFRDQYAGDEDSKPLLFSVSRSDWRTAEQRDVQTSMQR